MSTLTTLRSPRMVLGLGAEKIPDIDAMISGKTNLAGAALLAALLLSWSAEADNPEPVYYVSMRGIVTESTPTFVVVVRQPTADRTTLIVGCDGKSYYAMPSDAASISAARTNGEVVQLHKGAQGGSPSNAAIKCIIDQSGT